MNGLKIDFLNNTIIITKDYYMAASNDSSSEEYAELIKVQKDNPQMKVVKRTTNVPKRKSDFKGLDYRFMVNFITLLDKENLVNYQEVKMRYEITSPEDGTGRRSVFLNVRQWFLEQYPDYKESIKTGKINRRVSVSAAAEVKLDVVGKEDSDNHAA